MNGGVSSPTSDVRSSTLIAPLRLAVIGAGHLGRFHALIASRLPQIELVAVVDPLAEARNRVAAEAGVPAVADYRDVADQIEAAVVATPTHSHHAIGCDLLARGVALLVEKPLAASTVDADELVRLAESAGVPLQVGHVERFNPALGAVEAELNDPKYIEATRLSSYSFRSTDIGVVLDLMIHDLDVVLALARSPVARVQALGISMLGGHEDMATARLTFASGCVAQLTASRVSYTSRREMQVFTSRAFAAIDFATGQADLVKPREDVLRRELDLGQLSAEDVAYWKENLFDELLVKKTRQPPPVNAIQEEQLDFVHSVRNGQSPRVDGRTACRAVAVAEQILHAIDEHSWDGTPTGRCGPFAMPALPILSGPQEWHAEPQERRKAG